MGVARCGLWAPGYFWYHIPGSFGRLFFIGLFYEANIRALIKQILKVWFSQPSSQPLKD